MTDTAAVTPTVTPFSRQHVVVQAFRVIAALEALTWVALLIGMYFKWVEGHDEAVAVPGMVHGIVFVVLVLLTVAVAVLRRWHWKTIALGAIATVLPFCSLIFEIWAQRRGHLG